MSSNSLDFLRALVSKAYISLTTIFSPLKNNFGYDIIKITYDLIGYLGLYMNFIWLKKRISRFYTKLIINNFKRLIFNSYYFVLEGFNRAYYENKKKRDKKIKNQIPYHRAY